MSLLSLEPDVVRLRRLAKACQAGEMSRLEYRRTRRDVICKFVESGGLLNEDTVPRFDLDATLRRGFVAPVKPAAAKPRKVVWMCVLVALVAGLVLPTWAGG
ncbi:MAG: hypothetical protein AAF993_21140 [Pseudomonadota bacterium]